MSGRRFSLVMSVLGLVFVTGVHVDGWAHNHGRVDDTFFTPWHGMLYASLALMSFVAFMTQFVNPYSALWPTARWAFTDSTADELGAALGAAGFLWYSVVLSGFVLVLARRDRLPPGAAGLLVAGGAAFAVTQGDDYWLVVPAVIAAGILETVRQVSRRGRFAFRVLSGVVAGIPIAVHMAALALFEDVVWPVHLWAGTPVIAALVGMLIGLALVPPGSRVGDQTVTGV